MTALCPECEGTVALEGNAQLGEIVVCPDCGTELELTAVQPVTLAAAPKEVEDWGE